MSLEHLKEIFSDCDASAELQEAQAVGHQARQDSKNLVESMNAQVKRDVVEAMYSTLSFAFSKSE